MRAITVTYINYGQASVTVFSREYSGLNDEKMIKKVKHWSFLYFRKQYDAGDIRITFYSDIMDITTAVDVPL